MWHGKYMCSANGLFIGCSTLDFGCPCRLGSTEDGLQHRPYTDRESAPYRSPFRAWYTAATVRHAERRVLEESLPEGYFPSELVPVARHPEISSLPRERLDRLGLRQLYHYLSFTIVLEHSFITPVALAIYRDSYGFGFSPEQRLDALRVVTDEAYHGLFSADLLQQAEVHSGVQNRPEPPAFAKRLNTLSANAPGEIRPLLLMLFAIVSETLITTTLSDVGRTVDGSDAVRAAIQDHARDEGRHYAYFNSILRQMWTRLTPDERRATGAVVPNLVRAYLDPDVEQLTADLNEVGIDKPDQAQAVIAGTYNSDTARQQYQTMASFALRSFAELGVASDDDAVPPAIGSRS